MKERPILFSAPMVRALLAGRKTQTRRVVRPQPNRAACIEPCDRYPGEFVPWRDGEAQHSIVCPYGAPGDMLWVRETWSRHADGVTYRADFDETSFAATGGIAWRPSIHMPRALARITLRITEVRVERLQQISEADARAEGRSLTPGDPAGFFPETWNDIHGCGAWDANPWVWVVAFERVTEAA